MLLLGRKTKTKAADNGDNRSRIQMSGNKDMYANINAGIYDNNYDRERNRTQIPYLAT